MLTGWLLLRKALRRLKLWSGPHPINNGHQNNFIQNRTIAQPHIVEEWVGRVYTTLCIVLLVVTIVAIVYFVSSRGLSTFFVNGVSLGGLLTGLKWDPEGDVKLFGALPFIFGSFSTSLLAAIIAAPLGCLRRYIHDANYAGSRPPCAAACH